jgi:23S rRNA (guanosine2251-2'-O)-methyltransferase
MKIAKKVQTGGREKRIKLSDDILFGIHPVAEALKEEVDRVVELFLLKDRHGSKLEEIIGLARESKVKITFVSALKIIGEGGAQARHQGVIARMSHTALLPFEEMLERFRNTIQQGGMPRIIACDSLQDPQNLGAIIRSAHASGMAGVLITKEKSAPLGGTAAKASAGAVSHIDISQVTNLATALQQLKDAGAWIFGAVKDSDAQSLYQTDLRIPACFVVGSEGKGIRPLVRKQCDVLTSIPMAGSLDSLNSSVAAGVIMFEALRQNLDEKTK